jgi:hypothetical protein
MGLLMAWAVMGALPAAATSVPVAPPVALGPNALAVEMYRNPEIAAYVERRGYPDWVEDIEVDSDPPLDAHEIHLYYLRLDKEIAFTRAAVLGRPLIGLRKYERPLPPATRERIDHYYLVRDPARRAELAAARAADAAERAERGAAAVVDAADRTTRVANEMERSFHRHLRK